MTLNSRLGVERIVSGGQTGVDRGALEAAIELGIAHGGWCPSGRLAEDGPIDARYNLQETNERDYAVRTERNVIDSDGTLILYQVRLSGGTLLTNRLAKRHGKPLFRVRIDRTADLNAIAQWISEHQVSVLNVAGPRESSQPGIQQRAKELVIKLFGCGATLLATEE